MLSLQTKYIGSSVVIVCKITLNMAIGPDLSVLNYYWYYNIDITSNNQKLNPLLSIDRKTFNSTLQITSVTALNAGVYQCNAGIVGSNTITSNITSLCLKGIIIIYKLFYV